MSRSRFGPVPVSGEGLFELCQATGATPIPIVAAGVCCQHTLSETKAIPESEMDAYVQDVLDLVEFANGGTDTTWGKVREAAEEGCDAGQYHWEVADGLGRVSVVLCNDKL